jgi:hypothetical protein
MPERTRAEIQAAIAVMTVDEIRQILRRADLETDEAAHVRTLAAGMAPEAHKQGEYQCYVSEDGGDLLTELALDLYALVELPERGRRAPQVDSVERLPLVADLSPPF